MIPRTLREQIADELVSVAHAMRVADVEGDEAHAGIWLTSLDDRYDELMGQYSAEILSRQYQDEIEQSRKVYDFDAHRTSRFLGRVRSLSERFGLRLDT